MFQVSAAYNGRSRTLEAATKRNNNTVISYIEFRHICYFRLGIHEKKISTSVQTWAKPDENVDGHKNKKSNEAKRLIYY